MRETLVKTEEFKDSPVGRIPKDWDVKTLRELSVGGISNGFFKKPELVGSGYRLVNVFDLYQDFGIDLSLVERVNATEQEQRKYFIQPGDCFFTRSSLVLSGIAQCNIIRDVPEPALFECHLMRVRPDKSQVIPEFLALWCRSPWARKFFMSRAKQVTMTTISQPDIAPLPVPLPSKSEQESIVEIHDAVSDAIAHTSSLIAKLKQMKAGLLHDLLTRGLDENGELRDAIGHPEQFKDSPLGRIPKDWEIRTCESVCREIVVGIVIKPSQYYQSSGVPALRSANVREAGLNPSDLVFISERSNRLLAKSMIRTGDVLTVRTGYPGTSCVVPPEFNGANCVDIIISRPGAEIESAFLATWINSDFGKDQVLRVQGGLAQQHFNVGELQKLLIAKPSIEEQRAIQTRIEAYDTRIRAEEAYREKLNLQKKGLMHDLLTGKVRVKDADKFTPCK